MAEAISSQLQAKTQALHEGILALGIVVELYMSSSMKNIDDMIYIVHYLHSIITALSDEVNTLLREAKK